jgi:hypothetical protein
MINPALNRTANTPAFAMAFVLIMREPVNRPLIPRFISVIKIVDGLDKSSYSIPISNNPLLDPSFNKLEQGPKE